MIARDVFSGQAPEAAPHSPRPRILLADDHLLFTECLRKLLDEHFEICGSAENGRDLLSLAQTLQPDLVVMDISMPLLNGIDTARMLHKQNPDIKVVFLTMHSDAAYLEEALKAGAEGYVTKRSASRELLEAIRRVLRGKIYVSPAVDRGSGQRFSSSLSSRQREILQLVAEGKQNKEIAGILTISPRTVEFHKARIMGKLNMHTTAELTRFAIQHGIAAA